MSNLSTLERGLRILSLFSPEAQSLSIREIAGGIGLLESTAYRYVATLKSQGLLEESHTPGCYQLGLTLVSWYDVLRRRLDVVDLALPVMKRLRDEIGETVVLTAVNGQKGICLGRVESEHALRVSYERGATFFLHGGSTGKVLLAYLSREKQESVIRDVGLPQLTRNTITDPEKLREDLAEIRRNGYCVSDGEQLRGVRGISAPLIGKAADIEACITIEGPIARLEGKPTEAAIERITCAAEEISSLLVSASLH